MNIVELEQRLQELITLESNLKKSIYKKFLYRTLLEKEKLSRQLYTEIQRSLILLEDSISESKLNHIEKTSRNAFFKIQQILDTKLKNTKRTIPLKTLVSTIILFRRLKPTQILLNLPEQEEEDNMANATEVIKIASSLIPQYDGNGDKLSNIIAALKALKTIVTAATEPVALQIVLSKLEKKAKSAVGEAPANIDAIINSLNQKCKQHVSSDVVLAKLNAAKQHGTLNKFTSEIEEFTTQLEAAYINDGIALDTATKMANKAGTKALANGVKNPSLKTILKAGTFNTLNDAIGRAAENDNDECTSMQVLYFGHSKRGQRGGRNSYNNRLPYQNSYYQQDRSWYQNGYQQNEERRGNPPTRGGHNSNWRGSHNRNYAQNNAPQDQHQRRYNENTNRNGSGRGRIYHATPQENRFPHACDRNEDREESQESFLGERADRTERSSQ